MLLCRDVIRSVIDKRCQDVIDLEWRFGNGKKKGTGICNCCSVRFFFYFFRSEIVQSTYVYV